MVKSRKLNSTSYPIVFLMVDSADHVSGKAGLTVTVTISKNGGAFGAASGAVSELSNGWYSLAANATDRNTLGDLALHCSATGADPTDLLFSVVDYDPYNVAEPGDTMALSSAYDAAKTAAQAGDAMALTSSERSSVADSVWGATTRTLSGFGSLVSDVWAYATRTLTVSASGATAQDVWEYATRTLTDKAGFSLTAAYDKAKTAASVSDLSGVTIVYTGPVTEGGDISLVRGDDYFDADGRALAWTFDGLDLSGMTGVFNVGPLMVDCGIAGDTVTAELSADDTGLLSGSKYEYRLVLYSDGHKMTEKIALCRVS